MGSLELAVAGVGGFCAGRHSALRRIFITPISTGENSICLYEKIRSYGLHYTTDWFFGKSV